ncbi:MAG: lytic murein transglycosylase [Enhydrobacter sp.]|nr:MAG: lytic murein transglycosylase [Enhydrobacter sp.]
MLFRRSFCIGFAGASVPVLGATSAVAQDAKFAAWLAGVRQEAQRAGVDAQTLDAALTNVEPIPRVMELARNQPEFKMTFARYLEIVVSEERVRRGRELLPEHRAVIEQFSGPAGIPAEVVVALWGIESNYGTRLGDFDVVPALATLVYNNFRAAFFRSQLIAALKILSQGHVGLPDMKGSWAGAMGQCQFIPTSFLAYAADGDGDGRADIWRSRPDVFASTVNYLRRVGWRPGVHWGNEIGSAEAGQGTHIVRPAGADGPAFRTSENFKVILRWNQSNFFALAVGLLSDRIAGR